MRSHNKDIAIINRISAFGTLNGVIIKNSEIQKLVNQNLKAGTAQKLVDTEETLMYEVGSRKSTHKKYSAKQLTSYAEKIGFNNPKVWFSKTDGWWLESDKIEEYLGVDSLGAKSKLTELCKLNNT